MGPLPDTVRRMGPYLQYVIDHWPFAVGAVGALVFVTVLLINSAASRAEARLRAQAEEDELAAAAEAELDPVQEYVPGVGWQVARPLAVPEGGSVKSGDDEVWPEPAPAPSPLGISDPDVDELTLLRAPSFTPAPIATGSMPPAFAPASSAAEALGAPDEAINSDPADAERDDEAVADQAVEPIRNDELAASDKPDAEPLGAPESCDGETRADELESARPSSLEASAPDESADDGARPSEATTHAPDELTEPHGVDGADVANASPVGAIPAVAIHPAGTLECAPEDQADPEEVSGVEGDERPMVDAVASYVRPVVLPSPDVELEPHVSAEAEASAVVAPDVSPDRFAELAAPLDGYLSPEGQWVLEGDERADDSNSLGASGLDAPSRHSLPVLAAAPVPAAVLEVTADVEDADSGAPAHEERLPAPRDQWPLVSPAEVAAEPHSWMTAGQVARATAMDGSLADAGAVGAAQASTCEDLASIPEPAQPAGAEEVDADVVAQGGDSPAADQGDRDTGTGEPNAGWWAARRARKAAARAARQESTLPDPLTWLATESSPVQDSSEVPWDLSLEDRSPGLVESAVAEVTEVTGDVERDWAAPVEDEAIWVDATLASGEPAVEAGPASWAPNTARDGLAEVPLAAAPLEDNPGTDWAHHLLQVPEVATSSTDVGAADGEDGAARDLAMGRHVEHEHAGESVPVALTQVAPAAWDALSVPVVVDPLTQADWPDADLELTPEPEDEGAAQSSPGWPVTAPAALWPASDTAPPAPEVAEAPQPALPWLDEPNVAVPSEDAFPVAHEVVVPFLAPETHATAGEQSLPAPDPAVPYLEYTDLTNDVSSDEASDDTESTAPDEVTVHDEGAVAAAQRAAAQEKILARDADLAARRAAEAERKLRHDEERAERERSKRADEARKVADRERRRAEAEREIARRRARKRGEEEARATEKAAKKEARDAARAAKRKARRPVDSDGTAALREAAAQMRASAAGAAATAGAAHIDGALDLGTAALDAPDSIPSKPAETAAEVSTAFVIGSSRRQASDLDHTAYDLPEPLPRVQRFTPSL